jgi:hypothetical protein
MRLPCEIINVILEYVGNGKHFMYDTKRKEYVFRYNTNHASFKELHRLYSSLTIQTESGQEGDHETTVYYSIPLRRHPSLRTMESLHSQIHSIQNFMTILVVDNDETVHRDHYTSVVVETRQSTLLLN